MSHTYANINLHLIFSTKDRIPLITTEHLPRLHAYIATIARNLSLYVHVVGGIEDHIHALVTMPPKLSLSDVVREIKKESSSWYGTMASNPFYWQPGYGVFSVSRTQVKKVTEYIQNQREHHKKLSFDAEWRLFLAKHGMTENNAIL